MAAPAVTAAAIRAAAPLFCPLLRLLLLVSLLLRRLWLWRLLLLLLLAIPLQPLHLHLCVATSSRRCAACLILRLHHPASEAAVALPF